ncbi:MAG: hypothetical protein H6Q74_1206 [Firmicutes bacterium]|nr:hypothetical protein [Bacillota bacterium]
MSVMIVGADHLGNIKKNLQMYGMCDIDHMSGRMVSDRKKFSIPRSTSLVVVLTDFVNHGTAKNVKEQAKVQGVQTIFAKRSWCSLAKQLEKHQFLAKI